MLSSLMFNIFCVQQGTHTLGICNWPHVFDDQIRPFMENCELSWCQICRHWFTVSCNDDNIQYLKRRRSWTDFKQFNSVAYGGKCNICFDVSLTNATCKWLIIRLMWDCYFTARDYSRALWLPNLLTWILHADILIRSWFYLQPLINRAGATEAVWIIILHIKLIMSIVCFYRFISISKNIYMIDRKNVKTTGYHCCETNHICNLRYLCETISDSI